MTTTADLNFVRRIAGGDFYETPEWATEALFLKETFVGCVYEPACGHGAMVRIIQKYNDCIGSDILFGDDFLTSDKNMENIVTNPPYSLAEDFVRKARQISTGKVAMLLKLTFLESARRKSLFEDEYFPLSTVYVFSKRVQMWEQGKEKPKNSSMMAYAWFVWDKSHRGNAKLKWI